jgi:hypothetical protein
MPAGARVLSAKVRKGTAVVWAVVDPEEKSKEKHWFYVLGTGKPSPVPDLRTRPFLGTLQHTGGDRVFHVFDNGATPL